MSTLRIAFAVIFFSGIAQAQTPGVGETRPAEPAARERSGPADDVVRGAVIKEREPVLAPEKPQSDSDRAITRCNALSGALREECMRGEQNAGAGATRAIEPATAPPPQNPR
jgi:hypothetical protein